MRQLLKSCLIALPGGALFYYLHLPLPWMLGSLAAATLYKGLSGQCLYWPPLLRNAALITLGYAIGRPFSLETGRQIVGQLPLMLMVTIFTVAISLLMGYWMHRNTGVSLATGLIGSVPGGLSQMPLLAEETNGADVTVVTFMQTARVLAAVFTVPFLATHWLAGAAQASPVPAGSVATAIVVPMKTMLLFGVIAVSGGILARYLKMPNAYLLGPVIVTGATVMITGSQAPPLPPLAIIAAQFCTGLYLGASSDLSSMKDWRKLLPQVLLGAGGVVGASLVAGCMLSYFDVSSLTTGFLSTAPGGIAEMGLTAMLLHADTSMITAYQTFRLLFVLIIVPPFLKFLLKRTKCLA